MSTVYDKLHEVLKNFPHPDYRGSDWDSDKKRILALVPNDRNTQRHCIVNSMRFSDKVDITNDDGVTHQYFLTWQFFIGSKNDSFRLQILMPTDWNKFPPIARWWKPEIEKTKRRARFW